MIDLKKIKTGLSVMVADNKNGLLLASTIVAFDSVTKEIGVRHEINGESQLVGIGDLYLSHRKNGGGFQQQLEGYLVALGEGKISRTGLDQIVGEIKKRGPVKEIRTQELMKYY